MIATPRRQHHELDALTVAVGATAQSWNSVYLGPNLSIEAIAVAARQRKARAVALSLVYPSADARLGEELEKLTHLLESCSRLLIGDPAAGAWVSFLNGTDTRQLDSVADLRSELSSLRPGGEIASPDLVAGNQATEMPMGPRENRAWQGHTLLGNDI